MKDNVLKIFDKIWTKNGLIPIAYLENVSMNSVGSNEGALGFIIVTFSLQYMELEAGKR